MSLQQDMKLQDLRNEEKKFWELRNEIISQQLPKVREEIISTTIGYFQEKEFSISGRQPHLQASYNNGLNIKLDFSELAEADMVWDGFLAIVHHHIKFEVSYKMNRGNLPHEPSFSGDISSDKKEWDIKFLEQTMLPALRNIGVSDLDGSYKLRLIGQGRNQIKFYSSMNEILDEIFK
ncbi:hypothetical protein [Xenorhabdus budapestensis]|uniref:Uncharacterized protein n=1 Tax=Xenorhabdus budapestensis TaxID=290110 RepID=A0A2D0IP21_XENBU|nr:hypothetical protein [Xenorhabdus budapestensis]PHM23565.1 hypothetical protein Xbud_03552 [Xenorhabdus budapestensis]